MKELGKIVFGTNLFQRGNEVTPGHINSLGVPHFSQIFSNKPNSSFA